MKLYFSKNCKFRIINQLTQPSLGHPSFFYRGNGVRVGVNAFEHAVGHAPGRHSQSRAISTTRSMPASPLGKQLLTPTQAPGKPSREGNVEGIIDCGTPFLIKASQSPRLGLSEGFE